MKNTSDFVKIKNSLPWLETGTLSIIFLGTIFYSIFNILTISKVNKSMFYLPSLVVSYLIVILVLAFILYVRQKKLGSLQVNVAEQVFSLNGSSFLPFNQLSGFDTKISKTFANHGSFSTMTIILSIPLYGSYSLCDYDRFFFLPKGRTLLEISALTQLIEEAKLTVEQKKSFEVWAHRAKMIHKNNI